jgi:hypothetical protein
MSVFDEFGAKHPLFSLWESRKLVLTFTRHMGCRFCKEQVAELLHILPKLNEQGISAGIITVGRYEDIPRFKQENKFSGEVYVDSSLMAPECYKIMRLPNGPQFLFDLSNSKSPSDFLPETQAAALRSAAKGFSDGGYGNDESEYTGDVLQVKTKRDLVYFNLHFILRRG